jgi:hypothetical protein
LASKGQEQGAFVTEVSPGISIRGINSPWFIKDVSFDNKQLNIHIDFKKGTKFTDSSADIKAYTAYDTKA